jgi:predicted nucleic acid-binding protein
LIYLDTSVLLAQLLAQDRRPREGLWDEVLVSSRLLEYEVWVRLHARGLGKSHGDLARQLVGRVALLELVPAVLARALEPFPVALRTLDALHLASLQFLREHGQKPELASYDDRQRQAASMLGVRLAGLD